MLTRCTVDGKPAFVLRQGVPVLSKKSVDDPAKLEALGFCLGDLTIVGFASGSYGYVVWCLAASSSQRTVAAGVLSSLMARAPPNLEPVRVSLPDGSQALVPVAPGSKHLPVGNGLAVGRFVVPTPLLAGGELSDEVVNAHAAFSPRDQALRAFVEMLSRIQESPTAETLRAWAAAVL